MADPTVDPNTITTLPLSTGLARGIVVTSILFGGLSVISVTCRMLVKLRDRFLGWDDGLLAIGTLVYIPDIFFGIKSVYHGVAHPNVDLVNTYLQTESMHWYYIWIICYVVALLFIKTSICLTILRIAGNNRKYRISVYVLITCTIISFLVVFGGLMFYCMPLEAVWNQALVLEGKATCAPMSVLIFLSYASTVGTILTDLGCAVLPGVILYETQMKLEQKLAVGALLSFASVASITTIIRTPYIDHYNRPTDDLMFWVGHLILFSNMETGIGCIATSLPQLRLLWVRTVGTGNTSKNQSQGRSNGNNNNSNNRHLVTIGSAPISGRKKGHATLASANQTFATVYAQGDGEWEPLDNNSDKGLVDGSKKGIRAEYSFAVEMSDVPKNDNDNSKEGSISSVGKEHISHV